jgi:hypothetical protein
MFVVFATRRTGVADEQKRENSNKNGPFLKPEYGPKNCFQKQQKYSRSVVFGGGLRTIVRAQKQDLYLNRFSFCRWLQ